MSRLFTAIPFPPEIKNKARDFFRGRLPVAYVNTENLHITLNFLDEVADMDLELVKKVCSECLYDKRSFGLEFERVVKFNQQLHMTLAPDPDLEFLQASLERNFRKAGFSFRERRYYPHVKLANLHMDKVMNPAHRVENITKVDLAELNFRAEKVALFMSELLMHHARHTALEEYQLL